jgi:DNA-directed RNA polymerase subunit beta'
VQEYLLNEIQEVYRLQGVRINDKHIGVIVRQMLQKVKITEPGDTEYLEGEHVDRMEFRERTREVIGSGGKPPRAEPVLLGITKSSLTTESFISAASFKETTRVLTDAAVRGAMDDLRGLKENIIIGHLVPAGTGIHRYQNVEFLVGEPLQEELDAMRRTPPAPEEPVAAGGLFAELRGEMEPAEGELPA